MSRNGTPPRTVVWKSLDQYVRLEAAEGDRRNQHPVNLSAAAVTSALAKLQVEVGSNGSRRKALSGPELAILGPRLADALAQARPDQDVTFAITGMHPGTFSLERRLTTARVFHNDGQLQVIFGTIHGHYDPEADRRLRPFEPGSRLTPSPQVALLSTTAVAFPAGSRRDWVAMDVDRTAAEVDPSVVEQPSAARPASHPPEAVDPGRKRDGLQTIEERLSILNRLQERKLISDQEFRAKRREILDEL